MLPFGHFDGFHRSADARRPALSAVPRLARREDVPMGHIRESVHIDAPVDQVWEVAHDCTRFLDWQTGFVEIKDCQGSIDRVGASYTFVYKALGRRLEGRSETTKVDKPRLIETKETTPGGGRGTSIAVFESAGGGTDITLTLDYELPGGFIGDMANKLFMERALERDIRHSNENLKALCEAKVPVHT
jgi:uncharacterized membrane protein